MEELALCNAWKCEAGCVPTEWVDYFAFNRSMLTLKSFAGSTSPVFQIGARRGNAPADATTAHRKVL